MTSGTNSEAMQRDGKDIKITEVMDRWTLQMGYPVVTISKNDSIDSHEHFVYMTQMPRSRVVQQKVRDLEVEEVSVAVRNFRKRSGGGR